MVKIGIVFIVFEILNLCEKNENAKSIKSCEKKLMSTKKPSKEYEIPYSVLNVRKSNGDKDETTAIEIFAL